MTDGDRPVLPEDDVPSTGGYLRSLRRIEVDLRIC